jgi:hypothetical protein
MVWNYNAAQLAQTGNKIPKEIAPSRLAMEADDDIVVLCVHRPFVDIVLTKAVSFE